MPINSYDNYPLTWRPDKQKLKRPYYRSLIQQLEQDILKNKLQKNTQLPSQRELADYLDLNFTTVGKAYKYGIEKGLLYTNIGSGTFISPNVFESITISTNISLILVWLVLLKNVINSLSRLFNQLVITQILLVCLITKIPKAQIFN